VKLLRCLSLTLLAAVGLSGCLHQAVAIAPSSEPLAPGSYDKLGPVSGSDCLWKLLGLLPITSGNTLQGAMRDALEEVPETDALVQVTADSFQQYWILISRECTQVDGIAVRVRR
jgi:hypothetical protein